MCKNKYLFYIIIGITVLLCIRNRNLFLDHVQRYPNKLSEYYPRKPDKTEFSNPHKDNSIGNKYNGLVVAKNRWPQINETQMLEEKELLELGKLFQDKIYKMQNPQVCRSKSLFKCEMNQLGCGLGCFIHQIGRCMFAALGTNKTMTTRLTNQYYGTKNMYDMFPGVNKCEDFQKKHCSAVYHINSPRRLWIFIPGTYPQYLLSLNKWNINWSTWWIGQVLKYLSQVTELSARKILKRKDLLGVNEGRDFPIVGIHIRRTDKLLKEAKYKSNSLYMEKVEQWYENLAISTGNYSISRKVFVATDDVTAIPKLRKTYPHYTFLYDKKNIRNAKVKYRRSERAMEGILFDIHVLIDCDFVVCTFSSNICRLVYELMHTKYIDASKKVVSLDSKYYYFGGIAINQKRSRVSDALIYSNFNFNDTYYRKKHECDY